MNPEEEVLAEELLAEPGAFTLQIFHISDQEANVSSIELAPNLSGVYNALAAQDINNDGIAGFPHSLFLSSGDVWLSGLFYNASEEIYGIPGAADIEIQNELGIQAIAFGNHEFDFGTEIISQLLSGIATPAGLLPFDGADFPYLSGNLDLSGDTFLSPLVAADGGEAETIPGNIAASTIIEVADGHRIGIVGATTPTLASIASPGDDIGIAPEDFDSSDPADIAALAAVIQEDVDALLAANPDINKVVLLSHMQVIGIEYQLAELLSGVDIIIAGGSNTVLLDDNDVPFPGDVSQGDYPFATEDADGNPVLVVNTDKNYEYLGRLVIDFDEDGNIIPESYDPDVSGAYATDDDGLARVGGTGLIDPEIQAIADAVKEVIETTESNWFAVTDAFLNGRRSGDFSNDDPDGVRTQETNLGDLTADANLVYAKSYDDSVVVSLKNGGGIRADIGEVVVPGGGGDAERLPPEGVPGVKPDGGISQNDVSNALAFNNGLTLLSLTTEQLVEVLEHGIGGLPDVEGRFPQISGIKLSFDPALPAGERIQSAGIFDENGDLIAKLVENGETVDNGGQTFRVVTLGFLADGGDDYPYPDYAATSNRQDIDLSDTDPRTGEADFAPDGTEQDALAEYLLSEYGNEAGDPTYATEDTPPAGDERIQNLAYRSDSVFDGTGPVITPIYAIQGASQVSPLVLAANNTWTVQQFFALESIISSDPVTTTGIVTAVDTNGFYLQDALGDGNIATSDAIFVYTDDAPTVVVGDEAMITGSVSEFYPGGLSSRNLPTTQLTAAEDGVSVLSSGNALPAATIIGESGRVVPTENIEYDAFIAFNPETSGADFFESMEAMLVTVEDPVAVSGRSRFGEIFTAANQGEGATGLSERGTLNISPDDFNPEKIQIDEDTGILPGFVLPDVNVGASFSDITGVVSYDFGNFQVHPTEVFEVEASDLEAEISELAGSEDALTVASYNVLNLDPNDADGDTDVANFRFGTIAAQIINNLNSPDIIALQEIQDNSGSDDDGTVSADQTLQMLVNWIDFLDDFQLNGSLNYDYIDNPFITDGASGGQPGGNIRTAYIYNADRVELVDGSVATTGDQSEGMPFEGGRLPLIASFTFGGEEVTLVNNHLSSKSGSAPIVGTAQPFDERQEDPTVNGSLDERQVQAAAVANFIASKLASDPGANILALGDFNEFEFISPLTGLEALGLENLTNRIDEDERYSFNFQGNSQSLDHILVGPSLSDRTEFDIVHVNSEFAETATRASDHDPLLARLELGLADEFDLA